MIGQYTEDELIAMEHIISSVAAYKKGLIIRVVGSTTNYYRRERDGSWTNYKCETD